MRKRSLCCGRMRAHESRQCAARRISCNKTSWRAAKYGRAESPAHTRPPRGRSERKRTSGAVHPPPGGVPPAPPPCAGLAPTPQAAGECPAAGGPQRPGAPALRRPHSPGPAWPRRPPPAPYPGSAPGPTRPGRGCSVGATTWCWDAQHRR